MAYNIENKLVVGVSSSALFNLEKEAKIFNNGIGLDAYRKYQIENKNIALDKGPAFPFISRFLNINKVYSKEKPVEVVLLSQNSPETGLRIFNSIKNHGLDISRAAFMSGRSPFEYIPAYNISLFLSINENDVKKSIQAGYPAGRFICNNVNEDDKDLDNELRVAFDFDGVIADDEAEIVYEHTGKLTAFHNHETKNVNIPHSPGLLADFFKKISFFQKLESKKLEKDKHYKKILRTAIITARNAPSHERIVTTLTSWGVTVDEMFLLGGIAKSRVLSTMRPHIYFDDQLGNLDKTIKNIPLVHIPFGIKNKLS